MLFGEALVYRSLLTRIRLGTADKGPIMAVAPAEQHCFLSARLLRGRECKS
jgi:hypothetical protein